jgi:CheY-like chemotaxis protein
MILLVEDDAISRMAFAQRLRNDGYEVLEAGDGIEAIALLEEYHREVSLVIADMVLPNLNGLTLVRTTQRRWPRVPVIMVSAYLSKQCGDVILGPEVDVVEKPVTPATLVSLVERMLSHRQQA